MSQIPTRIEEYIEDLKRHNIQPCGMSNNTLNPTFTLKEDGLMMFNVTFTPVPKCVCTKYAISTMELPFPICHHILYILTEYYKINKMTIQMYHKLPKNFYELLVSYMDNWIEANFEKKQLKSRKKKNYNFTKETLQLKETPENINILNPMFQYYTKDECAICLDPLCSKPMIICPECHNYTHSKCALRWLIKKKGCHLCRDNPTKNKVDDDDEFPAIATKI